MRKRRKTKNIRKIRKNNKNKLKEKIKEKYIDHNICEY